LVYCKNDIVGHTAIEGGPIFKSEIFCLNNKFNGKYEGIYNKALKHGCGIFTWPSGLKMMREYENGKLISEKEMTPEIQANYAVQDAKQKWEEEKLLIRKQVDKEIEENKKKAQQDISLLRSYRKRNRYNERKNLQRKRRTRKI